MYSVKLLFRAGEGESYLEQEKVQKNLDAAMLSADEMAYYSVGYGLEDWKKIADFGIMGKLYYFYPHKDDDEGDPNVKYVIRVVRTN